MFDRYIHGLLLVGIFWLSLILFYYMFETVARGEEPPVRHHDGVMIEVPPEIMERIKKAVEGFQTVTPEMADEMERMVNNTFQKPDVPCNTETTPKDTKDKTTPSGVDGSTYYVFVSFSIPKETLIHTVREAMDLRAKGYKIALLLRGLPGGTLNETFSRMAVIHGELDPAPGETLPFVLEPKLFNSYSVQEVPVIFRVSDIDGAIARIAGSVSLDYAMRRLSTDPNGDHGKYGPTYPIEEKDFYELIAEKQEVAKVRIREKIDEIKDKMFVLSRHDGKYPRADKDRVYYIDPSVELEYDVVDQFGNVAVPRGTKINPLETITLGKYIIIDGRDPEQVQLALAGQYRSIMIVSGDIGQLSKKHQTRFYFVPDELLVRLDVKRVPVIFEQDGKLVRVTEKAVGKHSDR
ncbi:MAG TPA: TrbC family F-type conjugative pilus assembly protein [Methanoregulaceae archaeon]|nr:TrbC family F-type conjugative pilus assembly protein [Methanothrix sp.]HOL44400.1 TrbC family F-type conjugative pilus assembly protein [Methanothrix sp.]HPD11303.1 TrbC family F-type conjugative pilus assembly protein [Methanoregulaceae archaeon]